MELLSYKVNLRLTFHETNYFPKPLHQFTFPPAMMKVPVSPHSNLSLLFFLIIAILVPVKW